MRMLSYSNFVEEHRERDRRIWHFLAEGRSRRYDRDEVVRLISRRSAMSLFATNAHSRIAVAAAAASEFEELAARKPKSAHFITIALSEMATSLSGCATFDVAAAIETFRSLLPGGDYLGIVEVALYSNLPAPDGEAGPLLSWHCHVLDWSSSRGKIEQVASRLNHVERPLFSGPLVMHARSLSSGRIPGRAFYMMKAPLKDYRVYSLVREVVDPLTGEAIKVPTGELQARKQDLRPGYSLKVISALGDRTIPQLMFASGEGHEVRRCILEGAREELRDQGRAEGRRIEKLLT